MAQWTFGFLFYLSLFNSFSQGIINKQLTYKKIEQEYLIVETYVSVSDVNKIRPAIAFFHGGGWTAGAPTDFKDICIWFSQRGWKTFSFQYRLANGSFSTNSESDITPVESVKDARSAIRWLRENSDSLRIDQDKITVAGQSAGGQLALSTLLVDDINEESDNLDRSPHPNAVVLYSACVNTIIPWCELLMPNRYEDLWRISPYHNLKKSLSPMIAFHGENDLVADYWTVVLFRDKATQLGNTFDLRTIPRKEHYLGSDQYGKLVTEEILESTLDFLSKNQLD